MGKDTKGFSEIYRELAELAGETAALKIWRQYRGTSVNFPMRLYTSEYMREFIRANTGTMKPRAMARELGLTERRVRQIQQELRNTPDKCNRKPTNTEKQ